MMILSLMCVSDCFNLFRQGDGGLYCGLHVDNGRVKGTMKKTLREIVEKYNLNVRITPNQNIVLCDIRRAWRRPITTALAQCGLLVRYLEFTLGVYAFYQCFHPIRILHVSAIVLRMNVNMTTWLGVFVDSRLK